MRKKPIFYLIICILFSNGLFCQILQLKIKGDSEIETNTIDSLNYNKSHVNYLSIKSEMDSIQNALFKKGYIENELKYINRINDSLFSSKIILKKKYNTIYIYYNKSNVDVKILNMVSKEVFDDYFKLEFSKVESSLNYINSKISEKGFPFSKLSLTNIEIREGSDLSANLVLESREQKRTINDIVIKG